MKKDIKFQYGDKVLLQGEFLKGSEQRNTGGFDYQLYLKSINIYGTLKVEDYQKISSDNVNGIVKLLYTEYVVLPSSVVTVSVMMAFLLYKS